MVTAATASNFTALVFSSACSVAALGAHLLEKRRKKLGDDEPAADGLIFPKLCWLVSMMLPPAVGFLAHSAVYLVGRSGGFRGVLGGARAPLVPWIHGSPISPPPNFRSNS